MKQKLIALFLFLSPFLITCRHEIIQNNGGNPGNPGNGNGNGNGNNPSTCSPDSIYFTNTILPLISSGCAISGCHDQTTHKEGLILNNYSGIMRIVRAGNASESKLYKIITTTNREDIMPPPPHPLFSVQNILDIQKWINQGAKNNSCNAGCDTSVFTFSAVVSPLINTYCKGCHNPASLGGNIDLSTYNGIRLVALNGRLMGSISHAAGFVAMPQGSNKLDECRISQIRRWILSGVPNN